MEAMVDTGGALEVRRLIERVPPAPETVARVRALLEDSPLYGMLLSADGRMTAILLNLEHTEGSFDPKAKLVRDARRLIVQHAAGREALVAGGPALDEAMFRYSREDMELFTPLMLLLIIVCLAWLFRSVVAVVLPLGVVALSATAALGFMGWAGWDYNLVTTILPPILAAVGIADAVHLLQHLRLSASRGAAPRDALRQAFVDVLRPCLITSLTTAAGMASLLVASLQAMRELGAAAAVGVLVAFFLTVVGLPICLSVLPARWLGGLAGSGRAPTPRAIVRAADLSILRRGRVVIVTAAVVVLAILGMLRIEVGASMVSYFYDDDPVYVESKRVDEAFGGSFPLEVLVEATGDGDLLDPDALARIDRIAAYLTSLPATGRALSGVDFLREARRVLLGDPPGKLARPGSREEAAQILLLLEGEGDTARYLTDDYLAARIEVPVVAAEYQELVRRNVEIEARLAEIGGGVVRVRVTGLFRLLGSMEDYILDSQVRAFGLAFLLVTAFIALLFRSARVGLLAAIPNLLPLGLVLGLMGWTGIALDATTAMIAPLLLGIVVDDTVHVMERVISARRDGAEVPRAFRLAIEEVGTAVLLTTIVLTAGFLTPALGSFRPNLFFALLSAFALVAALVADLVVFPAVGCLLPRLVPGAGRRGGG